MLVDIYALVVKVSLLVDLTQQWGRNYKKIILKQMKFNRPEQNGLITVKLSYVWSFCFLATQITGFFKDHFIYPFSPLLHF